MPMSWRRKEPGHQQPWYLLCWIGLIRSPHVKGQLCTRLQSINWGAYIFRFLIVGCILFIWCAGVSVFYIQAPWFWTECMIEIQWALYSIFQIDLIKRSSLSIKKSFKWDLWKETHGKTHRNMLHLKTIPVTNFLFISKHLLLISM